MVGGDDTDGPLTFFQAAILGQQPQNSNNCPSREALISHFGEYKKVTDLPTRGPWPKDVEGKVLVSQEDEGPIQHKKTHKDQKEKRQQYDQNRNVGKISKKHAAVFSLPPLQPCKKKSCTCSQLVEDVDCQKYLRKNYVDVIKDATCNDKGNLILMSYLTPRKNERKEKKKRKEKNESKENEGEGSSDKIHYTHIVPKVNKENKVVGHYDLCVDSFCNLFGIHRNTLQSLKRRKLDPAASVTPKIIESGRSGFPPTVHENLTKILETEPRETSHYAAITEDTSRRYYYSGDLSLFHFWVKYLDEHGTEKDKEFLKQAKDKNFYPTFHREKAVKTKPEYTEEEPQIKPSVAYSTAIQYWNKFDVKFEARKCDICQTCFRLRCDKNGKHDTAEQKKKAEKAFFDHQKSATLHIFIRKEWKRCSLTSGFRIEHYQIDFGANPRCPYMDLGQAFYSRILGISVFIVVSTLEDMTYVYYFDEQTAKKGSDEVISCLHWQLKNFLSASVRELSLHCDGCAGQSWNNRLALYCEEILDEKSPIKKSLNINLKRIDLYRGVSGHTYMEPDTQGGRIQRAARKILVSRKGGFVHCMKKDASVDPEYAVGWADIAEGLDKITPVCPTIKEFYSWSEYLLPADKGGHSTLHVVPTPKHCFRGPHASTDSWRITKTHYINFGHGENEKGDLVHHPGVWFCREYFSQDKPDEVFVRNKALLSQKEWEKQRAKHVNTKAKQKQETIAPLSYLKRKDLYELGKLMARDKEQKDFIKRYPNPDDGKGKKSRKENEEMLDEVRSILRKDESKWKSTEYLDLLRWKKQKNISQFNNKAKREAQWKKLVSSMTAQEKEEMQELALPEPASEDSQLCLSRGHDPIRCDENEHVDNDEFFGVNDVEWRQAEYDKAMVEQAEAIKMILEENKDNPEFQGKSDEEKEDRAYEMYWDSFDDDHEIF